MTVYGASPSRERPGWFFGLTGPQLSLLVALGVPSWLAMAVGRWTLLILLVPASAICAALVCIPVRGWSAIQWIGVLARHLIGRSMNWTTFQSAASTGEFDADDLDRADLPGVLAAIEIHDGPPMPGRSTRPAVIQNHAARTWAATARVIHPGIGMADDHTRTRMGSALADLLEAAATGGQIDLLAIQIRAVPEDGTERADWVRRHLTPQEPTITARINDDLHAMSAGAAVRNEAFITVVVRDTTISKDASRAGRGITGRARVLYGILREVEARLVGGVGCTRVSWLTTQELAIAIRTGYEPGDAAALADATIQTQDHPEIRAGIPLGAAGPTNASTSLRSYRHGDWASVAATILLPRKGALLGGLARALIPAETGERRSLCVLYRPLPATTAARITGRAEMSAAVSAEMRRRVGRVERAKDRHTARQVTETDEKLERGRALVRVAAVVAVTVPATWNTHDHAQRLDSSIRLCGFAPLPLDGAHDAAFATAAIPVGLGLPNARR